MDKYDFSGWATINDVRCSDGRTIRHNAFKECDGKKVPLVWNHQHNSPDNILGHALLKNTDKGVYAYGTFNDTESGRTAKELVCNGDLTSLSIFANQLKQSGGDVLHGAIREVSLVLAGANPGAFIDSVSMAHSDEYDDTEAIIYTGENFELYHSDEDDENDENETDSVEETNEETAKVEETDMNNELEHSADETIEDVYNTLNEKQKLAVEVIVGSILEEKGDNEMKHNLFDNDDINESNVISHAEIEEIINDGKKFGSLKESFLAHAEAGAYGIEDIDYLFPEAKSLNNPPEFISREMSWVTKVMNGVHHTPFSRIKSMFADIREDEARAKGYIKGKLKKEEVFSLLKRTTTPTTIYKKQKLDRDDIVDITDFNVVAWLKAEMRMMLNEEIARAILIGDGRLASDDDHINHTNIRPIVSDADLYTIKKSVTTGTTETETAKNFINTVIRSRKSYKGSGNPTLYTTEDVLTEMLLIEDGIGHKLYKTEAELATTLRVKEIVTVEVMEGQKGPNGGDLMGLIVNLSDYNVGADKGGEVNMFDDFDIDYNQQKYLIETRCSGALVKPFSAIALEKATTQQSAPEGDPEQHAAG